MSTALGLYRVVGVPCGNQMQKVFTLVPDSFYTLIVPALMLAHTQDDAEEEEAAAANLLA